jgi:hypothetical protein
VAPMRPTDEEMSGRPGGGAGTDDTVHQEPVVRDLYDRMSRAQGMLS